RERADAILDHRVDMRTYVAGRVARLVERNALDTLLISPIYKSAGFLEATEHSCCAWDALAVGGAVALRGSRHYAASLIVRSIAMVRSALIVRRCLRASSRKR